MPYYLYGKNSFYSVIIIIIIIILLLLCYYYCTIIIIIIVPILLLYHLLYHPDRGIVGRVTGCGVRGLGFKSPGSILTSRTETNSVSRVVRDGWDKCSVPLSDEKKSHAVESSTWPLNSHNCSENYPKSKTKQNTICIILFIYNHLFKYSIQNFSDVLIINIIKI